MAGVRIRVHRNLHRGDWSVVDPGTGRVVEHVTHVELVNCVCRVQAGGQAAVRRTRVRSVHAYVLGERVTERYAGRDNGLRRFSYNPYRDATFVDVASQAPVLTAAFMRFDEKGAWYLWQS